jgi:hypothetical protein
MGIRIDPFAIDTPRFCRALEVPLWRVLRQVARRAPRDHFLFHVFEPDTRFRYVICPDGRILRTGRDGAREFLQDDQLAASSVLQQSCLAYLLDPNSSGYALLFLLRDWADWEAAEAVHLITEGHRRWWVGSVLSAAARVELPLPQYRELSAILGRMLAGWDCGVQIPAVQDRDDIHFPIYHDNPDKPMAVFSAGECHALVDLLELLLKRDPIFESPTPGDSDDFDWNQYAREMIGYFVELKRLVPPCTHMVTFIG